MSQPTPYTPSTDFSQQESINASGRSTVNTSALDAELANIETTLDQTLANLELLQRDDGRLKDLACELHTLSPEVLNLIGGFSLRGLWQGETLYSAKDIVSNTEYTYFCRTQHTSGVAFDEQYWIQFGFSGGADAAQAAAAAQVSANNSSASAAAAALSATAASGSATASAASASASAESASAAAGSAGDAAGSATNSSNSAAAAEAAAASLPNAPSAGSDKILKSSNDGLTWEYLTAEQARAFLWSSLATSFKNKLPNGAFRTNQRGYVSGTALAAGVPSTGVGYGHDGWRAGAGGGTYTFTQTNTFTPITITAGTFITAAEGLSIDSGTMLLAWEGTAQARVGVNGAAPSGTYAASPILVSCTPGQQVSAEFGTGTVGKVKLINGSVDDGAYEYPHPENQLKRCQRFLPSWAASAIHSVVGMGQTLTNTSSLINISFKERARVAPTGIISSAPGTFYITNSAYIAQTVNGLAVTYSGLDSCTLTASIATSISGTFVSTMASTGASSYLLFTGGEL